jgi:hypothetical protein
MNLRRVVVLLVAALTGGIVLILLSAPRGPGPALRPSDWLHIVAGPNLCNHTNAQGGVSASAILTLSNAGPRQLMFRLEDLRWSSGNSQGSANALLGDMHLVSGATTNIALPTTGIVTPEAAYVIFWNLPWWEEATGVRHFLVHMQQRSRFPLWRIGRIPPLMSGRVEPPRTKGDEDAYFHLKYGLVQRTLEPRAEPYSDGNGSQPFRSK